MPARHGHMQILLMMIILLMGVVTFLVTSGLASTGDAPITIINERSPHGTTSLSLKTSSRLTATTSTRSISIISTPLTVRTTPLIILNDTAFETLGLPGSGTADDPYRIEHFNFSIDLNSASGEVAAIFIANVTKHFTIRTNVITFYDASSTTFHASRSYHDVAKKELHAEYISYSYGIRVANVTSSLTTIENNEVYGAKFGIEIFSTNNVIIKNNTVMWAPNDNTANGGIWLTKVNNSIISNNTIIGQPLFGIQGISIISSENVTASNNVVITVFFAISASFSHEGRLINNYIETSYPKSGVMLFSTSNYVIHHNQFIKKYNESESQAYDDSNNTWYDVSTREGNYWSDWNGTGPYPIAGPAGSVDPYPLPLNATDLTPPSFTTVPLNITYELGTTGHVLNWTVTDDSANSGTYTVYRNGTEVASGTWNAGNTITVSVDGLEVGTYNYTVVVTDQNGNYASDTVFVIVVDTTPPTFTSVPANVTYELGTTGHVLSWTATDLKPSTYTVYRNGTEVQSGSWTNGTAITISVDGLDVGTYNYTIVVFDQSGNRASDTAFVTVISSSTIPSSTSSTTTSSTTTSTTTSSTSSPTSTTITPSLEFTIVMLAFMLLTSNMIVRRYQKK